MRAVMFYHSLASDVPHLLRSSATELVACGHAVRVCEDRSDWSARNTQARCVRY